MGNTAYNADVSEINTGGGVGGYGYFGGGNGCYHNPCEINKIAYDLDKSIMQGNYALSIQLNNVLVSADKNACAIMANDTSNTDRILAQMNQAEKDCLKARICELESKTEKDHYEIKGAKTEAMLQHLIGIVGNLQGQIKGTEK